MKLGLSAAVIGLSAVMAWATSQPDGQYYGLGPERDPTFDCAAGFQALVSEIRATPAIRDWGDDDSPTRLFEDEGRAQLYIVTNKGHPAYPAVIRRSVIPYSEGMAFATQACSFGNRAALEEDLKAYAALDAVLGSEFQCFLCTGGHVSPSLERNMLHQYPPPL